MKNKLKAHIFVLVATFFIAGSFIASEKLAGVIDPISLTLFRFIFALLFLSPLIFINHKYRDKIISTLGRGMIISLFYSLYFIGLFKALESTTALNTGTLFTLLPLLTAILSVFIFKQNINIYQFFIYLMGIIGTCIVIFEADIMLLFSFSLNNGDIIFLFAILFMALYSISTKKLYKKDDELIVLVFVTLLGGSIWMTIALFFLDIPLQWYKIEGENLFYMFYLTIAATLLTVYLYQHAAVTIGPKKVMLYIYLNPAAIAMLLFIFENKVITSWMFIGILISSLSTIFLLIKDKK
jgi:drug/metabolite transporter (DMT)-like permease